MTVDRPPGTPSAAGVPAGGDDPSATPILQLGDPRLRTAAAPVDDVDDPAVRRVAARLESALRQFRAEHGFGRAIAAPQIGSPLALIAVDLGDDPQLVVNPEITWRSSETFTLWDDCLSFPDLLVRVRRHRSISVAFTDRDGADRTWDDLPPATAELLQHEIDHLHGVLAIDRAVDRDALVTRAAFDSLREHFLEQVDAV